MNGSQYRKLRKQSNIDEKKAAKKSKEDKKYSGYKADFVSKFTQFNSTDDLFMLIETIRSGVSLLSKAGFPTDEFFKYEKKQ